MCMDFSVLCTLFSESGTQWRLHILNGTKTWFLGGPRPNLNLTTHRHMYSPIDKHRVSLWFEMFFRADLERVPSRWWEGTAMRKRL